MSDCATERSPFSLIFDVGHPLEKILTTLPMALYKVCKKRIVDNCVFQVDFWN